MLESPSRGQRPLYNSRRRAMARRIPPGLYLSPDDIAQVGQGNPDLFLIRDGSFWGIGPQMYGHARLGRESAVKHFLRISKLPHSVMVTRCVGWRCSERDNEE